MFALTINPTVTRLEEPRRLYFHERVLDIRDGKDTTERVSYLKSRRWRQQFLLWK